MNITVGHNEVHLVDYEVNNPLYGGCGQGGELTIYSYGGIYTYLSDNLNITDNLVYQNRRGICLQESANSFVLNNTVHTNEENIELYFGQNKSF